MVQVDYTALSATRPSLLKEWWRLHCHRVESASPYPSRRVGPISLKPRCLKVWGRLWRKLSPVACALSPIESASPHPSRRAGPISLKPSLHCLKVWGILWRKLSPVSTLHVTAERAGFAGTKYYKHELPARYGRELRFYYDVDNVHQKLVIEADFEVED